MARFSIGSRVVFVVFVCFLACLTSMTVIFFSMALLDDAFVYAGIACLVGVGTVIAVYLIYRACGGRCKRFCFGSTDSVDGEDPQFVEEADELRQSDFRRLEREIEDLFEEVSELHVSALCSSDILDRENENIRREYDQLREWIEGSKTPENSEIRELITRIESIRTTLQNIRRRTERITANMAMRALPLVNLNLTVQYPQLPPTYEESRRPRGGVSMIHTVSSSVNRSHLSLPSYTSEVRVTPGPPPDDFGAPPAYEDAIGVHGHRPLRRI